MRWRVASSHGRQAISLFLRFPSTVVLVGILAFGTANSIGWIPYGPVARTLLVPAVALSRLMQRVGEAVTHAGLPCPGAVSAMILVLGSVLLDLAMQRAME